MASYMYLESPKDVPFNWVLRRTVEERKDQLLKRAGEGKPIPTRHFHAVSQSDADVLEAEGRAGLLRNPTNLRGKSLRQR